jgi:hypothetical protein
MMKIPDGPYIVDDQLDDWKWCSVCKGITKHYGSHCRWKRSHR